jgi:hypothetical protein
MSTASLAQPLLLVPANFDSPVSPPPELPASSVWYREGSRSVPVTTALLEDERLFPIHQTSVGLQ